MNNRIKIILAVCLTAFLIAGDAGMMLQSAEAGRRSFGKSSFGSRSFNRSSSPSKSVWGNRSGGGFFGLFNSTKKSTTSNSSKNTSSYGYSKPGASNTSTYAPKSSSSSYGKPSSGSSSSSGYSKPSSKSTGKSFSSSSSFDKNLSNSLKKEKAAASLDAYKAEKNKFKTSDYAKPKSDYYKKSKIYKNSKSYGDYDYRTYYDRRDDYYSRHNWRPPNYVYYSRPSFGMWDALIWWSLLDNLNDRNRYAMAYHHQNDPGYKEWRAEANRLANENSDLKGKLDELDKKVSSMGNVPVNPDYLPDGIPSEVALASDVMAEKDKDRPVLRFATASPSGNYQYFGSLIKENAKDIDVELRNTAGSMENLQLLVSGEVDAAIIQSDAFTVFKKMYPDSKIISSEQTVLYPEAVQMIANTKSGIKSVKDIETNGRHVLYIGPKGSGTEMTWRGLVEEDPDKYAGIETRNASYDDALQEVMRNENAVMMFVSGLKSSFLQKAEDEAKNNGTIRLVEVNDWDFNDARDDNGNRIYRFVIIPKSTYPGLQKVFIFEREIETIAVDAVMVVSSEWAAEYGPDAMDALSYAVMEAQPIVAERVNGLGS